MYDRNIKFDIRLSKEQIEALDNYVKNTMNIQDEYEIIQDFIIPYIFIRVKPNPKKINTNLTITDLNDLALGKIPASCVKNGTDVEYDGNLDEYVKELKSCNWISKDQSILIKLYDDIRQIKEVMKSRDERFGYGTH